MFSPLQECFSKHVLASALMVNFLVGLPYIPSFFYCTRYIIDLVLFFLASNLRERTVKWSSCLLQSHYTSTFFFDRLVHGFQQPRGKPHKQNGKKDTCTIGVTQLELEQVPNPNGKWNSQQPGTLNLPTTRPKAAFSITKQRSCFLQYILACMLWCIVVIV